MKKFIISLLLSLLTYAPLANAQASESADELLRGMLSISESKCQSSDLKAREYEEQGKMIEADVIRNTQKTICDCMPNQIRTLLATLSKKELKTQHTESSFAKNLMPKVVDICAAEQLKSTYSDGCEARFSRFRRNSTKYCACMSEFVARFSNAEIMQMGYESSDYDALAAEARKRGHPSPEQPQMLKQFSSRESMCAAN